MIDLHCHILPGIDDGARDVAMALEMARIAEQDGIEVIVCTPHITPGIYDNDAQIIADARHEFQRVLLEHGINLRLLHGCDMHVSPLMPEKLHSGEWPSIASTRYFLFEPPHHVAPPNLTKLADRLLQEGWIPVLTHPERLTWIDAHYEVITELDEMGVAIQITAGALSGRFGKEPRYWAERLLDEGRVDIIATDAHNVRHRPPILSEGYEHAAKRVGEDAARAMVLDNPRRVLANEPLTRNRHKPVPQEKRRTTKRSGWASRLWRMLG